MSIQLEHLTFAYENSPSPLFRSLSFSFDYPKTYLIEGSNGSGRTTLLKLIAGLLDPTEGWVRYLAPFTRESLRIGFVFQNSALFEEETVGHQLRSVAAAGEGDLREWFSALDLPAIEHKYPRNLSGGMQKRVALIRALIHRPHILLCDDPAAGLDPITTLKMYEFIFRVRRKMPFLMIATGFPPSRSMTLFDEVRTLVVGGNQTSLVLKERRETL